MGVTPYLYVNHTVEAKENYYSIGRIYNISPKEIAPFNNLVLENGLSLGQNIKIPLTTTNFVQTVSAAGDEALVPVYHTVDGKEGLYRISVNYNKVPVESLKKWNNLKSDAVGNGTSLVVGYLKVKKDLSTLGNMAIVKPAENTVKTDANANKAATVKVAEKPAVPDAKATTVKEKPPVVENVKKEPVAVVAKESSTVKKDVSPATGKNFNGGAFKSDYEQQTQNKDINGETGEGAIFKSTSGWEDGKYYCLHNTSSPGTIVKITNSATGKSIYAKVLDIIPDIKQNTGLIVRVSNAAAQELGSGDTKFDCTINYSK